LCLFHVSKISGSYELELEFEDEFMDEFQLELELEFKKLVEFFPREDVLPVLSL
jgi:hypothetical protein